jgi:uncharacterized protein (DUF305 family)
MRTTRITRAFSAFTLTAALALTAAACGNDDAGTTGSTQLSTTEHNAADVAFASDMLQHHAQALAMVDLTMGRTLDPVVRQLAEQIRDAQAPEIEMFTDWLTDWDEEVPETVRDHANAGHDMDDMGESMSTDMPGMMTSDDMAALEDASDAEFQTLWLEMMIEHHEGAVEMATTEQGDGQYKDAVDLAGDIVTSQSAEVDAMKGLLP